MAHPPGVGHILAGLDTSPRARSVLPQELVQACASDLAVSGVGIVLMVRATPAGVIAASDDMAKQVEDL